MRLLREELLRSIDLFEGEHLGNDRLDVAALDSTLQVIVAYIVRQTREGHTDVFVRSAT